MLKSRKTSVLFILGVAVLGGLLAVKVLFSRRIRVSLRRRLRRCLLPRVCLRWRPRVRRLVLMVARCVM